jgi:large subunit ribosomal protein L9
MAGTQVMAGTKAKKRKRQSATRLKRLPHGPNGGIELLLIQSVDHLGSQGDVVEVKSGFAKNYLLPQGLATLATEHHKRMVAKHQSRLSAIEEQRLAGLRAMAENLSNQSVTIEANANDEGHLYGSVGEAEIIAAMKRNEITITEDQICLEGPLRELGLYTIKILFGHEIEGSLKVWVVPAVVEEGEDTTASTS